VADPVRVYFVSDDPAALWRKGDTADDLGPDGEGRHQFRLDHFDEAMVVIDEPYARGIVRRLGDETPPGFSDEELDAYLDRKERDDTE